MHRWSIVLVAELFERLQAPIRLTDQLIMTQTQTTRYGTNKATSSFSVSLQRAASAVYMYLRLVKIVFRCQSRVLLLYLHFVFVSV